MSKYDLNGDGKSDVADVTALLDHLATQKKPVVVLDPGHGKKENKSPTNPLYVEGTQMWILADKLKKKLEEKGCVVYTTRPDISDNPSLKDRGKTAGEKKADLFISIHSNAPSKSTDGTYDTEKRGTVSCYSQGDKTYNKPLANKLSAAVAEIFGHKDLGSFYSDYPGKPGVDYYGVLRYAASSGCRHALIVEHGYHTNLNDSNFLLNDTNIEKIAEKEAEIIAEYLGIERKVIYKVQVGAYSVKSNAEKELSKLKTAGFSGVIVEVEK